LKQQQDYGSVLDLGLTGGSFPVKEKTAPFNKITISVDTLHGLRIREAIPSPCYGVLCKLEGR
jgi:hypothetical protein